MLVATNIISDRLHPGVVGIRIAQGGFAGRWGALMVPQSRTHLEGAGPVRVVGRGTTTTYTCKNKLMGCVDTSATLPMS